MLLSTELSKDPPPRDAAALVLWMLGWDNGVRYQQTKERYFVFPRSEALGVQLLYGYSTLFKATRELVLTYHIRFEATKLSVRLRKFDACRRVKDRGAYKFQRLNGRSVCIRK